MKTPITARHVALGLFGVFVVLLLALFGMTRVAPGTTVEAPVLTSVPADPTSATTNTAAWVDDQPGVRFRCSMDDGSLVRLHDAADLGPRPHLDGPPPAVRPGRRRLRS